MAAARADGLVVCLTGSLPSAVTAALCHRATPGQVVGLIVPSGADADRERDAHAAAEHLGIRVAVADLRPAGDLVGEALARALAALGAPAPSATAVSNLAPRLRTAALYFLANSMNYLVAGATTRCELTVGHFTKHGDAADLLPLGSTLARDVRALAQDLGLPRELVDRPAPPDRRAQGSEQDVTSAALERYLTDGPDAVPPAVALRIERMMRTTEHKRTPPAVPDETSDDRELDW